MTAQTYEFQTETVRLLELMIHSLYSNKDIFLRELISNGSDALDKRRFAGITDPSLAAAGELRIVVTVDRENRTVTVDDNGIGMSRDEVVENIGTIARSGTQEFAELLKRKPDAADNPELIGQFGVGFYSSFLVAGRVELVTRKAGEDAATKWESDGTGQYTLDDARRDEPGTSVTLHLTAANEEEGVRDYADPAVLESIIRTYSDFVAHPIRLARGEADPEVVNSMKAIWTRPESEVSETEWNEFYRHVAHDMGDPLLRVSTRIEGTFEARALLFVPKTAPWDLFHPHPHRRGVKLYVKRVFIMDDCEELLPPYLRFVRGVVDAEDLPLNISREILQENRQIKAIRKHITKKVLDALAAMKKDERDRYEGFWSELGAALKEGLLFGGERNERVLELVLGESALEPGKLVSLDEYVDGMARGQDVIYYITAESAEAARRSPHLEAFRDRGIEVLVLPDRVDELWPQMGVTYRDKALQAVGRGQVDLPGEGGESGGEEASQTKDERERELRELLLGLRSALQEQVKDVRVSSRLTSSAACLVTDEGDLTPQMERLMREGGREVPKTKRILELNPDHDVIRKLRTVFERDGGDPRVGEFARLLYGQAVIAEGGELDDPVEFARALSGVMASAMSADVPG